MALGKKNNFNSNLDSDGKQLCKALQEMGTTFIKLGQFLATRPDIIGENLAKDLETLQDKLPEFEKSEAALILKKGLDYGLLPRIHSDEFNNLGASKLGEKLNLISADHLMKIGDDDIGIMADTETKAVLLPGTTFFLGHSNYAPNHKLKEAGVEVAIATDYNPGSCNIQSMIFIIAIATIFMKMDILDAIYSSTYIPAKLLNISDKCGSIENGKKADIIIWDIYNPIQIPYKFSTNPIKSVIKSGKFIF